jgi:hypothetical protein
VRAAWKPDLSSVEAGLGRTRATSGLDRGLKQACLSWFDAGSKTCRCRGLRPFLAHPIAHAHAPETARGKPRTPSAIDSGKPKSTAAAFAD